MATPEFTVLFFGWAMDAKRLESFWLSWEVLWTGKVFWLNSSRMEYVFDVREIECANVSECAGCLFCSNPVTKQNFYTGQFCKTTRCVQCQEIFYISAPSMRIALYTRLLTKVDHVMVTVIIIISQPTEDKANMANVSTITLKSPSACELADWTMIKVIQRKQITCYRKRLGLQQ